MQGPDPCPDNTRPDDDFEFNGTDGMSYIDFLQRIRRMALSQGKSRDFEWMADLAGSRVSGEAFKWFERLDAQVQQDWNLLRKAFARKYGDENDEPTVAEDTGTDANVSRDPLLPAKVEIDNWNTPAFVSGIRFPKSEGEWLDQARRRKAKFGDNSGAVYWRLVEAWEPIPRNAILTGNEGGTQVFSLRVWKDGCLTIGKQIPARWMNSTRAWVPWRGGEIQWSGLFEILVGDQSAVRWVSPKDSGRFHAVEGGFETGRPTAMLIAQFNHENAVVPGKVFSGDNQGQFGWWGGETYASDFRVLAWK